MVMDITEWNDSIYVTNYDFKMAVLMTKNKMPYRLENRLSLITKGRFLSSIHNQDQVVVANSIDGLQVFNKKFEKLDSFEAPFIWKMERAKEMMFLWPAGIFLMRKVACLNMTANI